MNRKYTAIRAEPEALVIHCGDPRFSFAFRNFIAEKLGLAEGRFILIEIAGGPAALAHSRDKMGDYDFLTRQIKFFHGHFPTIKKDIIMGHQDCGYYTTIENNPAVDEQEKKDLSKAVKTIHTIVHIPAEAYYAKFVDGMIAFEKAH